MYVGDEGKREGGEVVIADSSGMLMDQYLLQRLHSIAISHPHIAQLHTQLSLADSERGRFFIHAIM